LLLLFVKVFNLQEQNMSNNEFDIPLTESQIESLSRVSKSIREKFKLTDGVEAINIDFWLIYIEYFIYQSRVASSGKKKSTQTTQRRSVLKRIKQITGHFPTENDIRAILAHGDEIVDESVIPLIMKDIERLSITPSRNKK
jgi:hypothetical protein